MSPKGRPIPSGSLSLFSGTVDIENERRKASFDPRRMNAYLHGGEDLAKVPYTCIDCLVNNHGSFVK